MSLFHRTQYEFGVAINDVSAANVDEPDAGGGQCSQGRVHIVQVMNPHAAALTLLQRQTILTDVNTHTHAPCLHEGSQ